MKKKVSLTVPQLMFVVGTRMAIAAGAALLLSRGMRETLKTLAGTTLVGAGILTTVPAAQLILKGRKPSFRRLRLLAA